MRRTAVAQQNEIVVNQGPPGFIAIVEINDVTETAATILIPSSKINMLVHCLRAAKRDNDRDF